MYDEDDVFGCESTLGESSPVELNTGTTGSSVSDQETFSGMYLTIDRRDEMSKSTETIVGNGEFSGDDYVNAAKSDDVRLVNGACDEIDTFDVEQEKQDSDIVRQRPSIVINHCESIDQNGDLVEKTEDVELEDNSASAIIVANVVDSVHDENLDVRVEDSSGYKVLPVSSIADLVFNIVVKKQEIQSESNNGEFCDDSNVITETNVIDTNDSIIVGSKVSESNVIKETNIIEAMDFEIVVSKLSESNDIAETNIMETIIVDRKVSEDAEAGDQCDEVPVNDHSESIEETNVDTPSTRYFNESNTLEQNTIVRAITRIDDVETIVPSNLRQIVADVSVGNKMLPVSSMADLVFNIIVEKPEINSETNNVELSDNLNDEMMLDESSKDMTVKLEENIEADVCHTETIDEPIESTEHREPIKTSEPIERTASLESSGLIRRVHYFEQSDSAESFDRDLIGKTCDVSEPFSIFQDEHYRTNYETPPALLEKVIIVARDMRCIDEKDAVMMERVRRQQSEEALRQITSLGNSQNKNSGGTIEIGASRNGEKIDENSDNNDAKEISENTKESPENISGECPDATENKTGIAFPFKLSSFADCVYNMIVERPCEDDDTIEDEQNGNVVERSKVLFDAANNSESSSQSDSGDEAGNEVKTTTHPKILLTKDSIESELGSQPTSLDIEVNGNSLEVNSQNISHTSPLLSLVKRTNSVLSLREELLESLGSISKDHEKSPDLDDLLSSIGPVGTHNEDYDDETYESDFDENVEILGHREKKHHCRRKHEGSRGLSNSPEGSESETCECERGKTVCRNNGNELEDVLGSTVCDCQSSSLSYNQRRQHYYRSEASPADSSCHGIDVDLLDALNESCHIPVIKSIDKIISTLENVLEPLEQITDSATESEISCSYKRRGARTHHVENLNLLIAKLNHINASNGELCV